MPICGIFGCQNRPGDQKDISFFKVPTVLTGQGEETRQLSSERRRLWKGAISRKDITTEEKWDRTLVCSKHFVGGSKAYLHDRSNPSWLPSVDMGTKSTVSPSQASDRFQRASQRKEKRKVSEAISSLQMLKKRHIDFSQPAPDNECTPDSETPPQTDAAQSIETQTDISAEYIALLEEDQQSRLNDKHYATNFHVNRKGLYEMNTYARDPEKVAFYTGLPTVQVLLLVFHLIEEHMNNNNKCLSKENAYLLCLVKMRMNYVFKDIADQLSISVATVQRSFHATLDVLYVRLNFLIHWPSRENLRTSMPMCFRKEFGHKVVVILDCFELFTERPSSSLNKVYTYSNYKHHQTIKYLIGIAPQGVVTYISDGWGGRTSDKHITEKCGLLNNLLPGDVVMVDRGFCIEDAVNFYQAELLIPNFTHGKSQLHPLEVEKTRKIASVRIHVERVIGLVLRKFRIFESIIPLEFVKLKQDESVPTIDKLVKVACCLTNLCPSVVPFE